MKTPTKVLVLLVVIAVVAASISGCIRKVEEDQQYTELENLSELGITETGGIAGEGGVGAEAAAPTAPAPAETVEVQTLTGGQIVVREGQLVEIKPKGYDPDGDVITYTFSAPLDESGKWQTKEGDKGTYNIKVTASDGKSTVTKDIVVVVKEANKAPVLADFVDIEVKVGETIKLVPKATDPNFDELAITYSGWMTSAEKTAAESDIGTHSVTVTVSDGELSDSKTVTIKVVPVNNAPVMERIKDIAVKEGGTVTFDPKVVDPDGDEVTITYSGWMTSASYTTDYDDAGEYIVKITASDGKLETSQSVKVAVENENRPVQLEIEFEIS